MVPEVAAQGRGGGQRERCVHLCGDVVGIWVVCRAGAAEKFPGMLVVLGPVIGLPSPPQPSVSGLDSCVRRIGLRRSVHDGVVGPARRRLPRLAGLFENLVTPVS
jgi:hypothetical protein